MKIIKSIAIAASAVIFTACNQAPGGTSISGEATGVEEMTLLAVSQADADTVATISVKEQSFEYQIEGLDSTQLFFLQVGDMAVPLFIQPEENVKLTISSGNAEPDYAVEGSPESERVKEIRNIMDSAMARVEKLNQEAQQLQAGPGSAQVKARLDSTFQAIIKESSEKYKVFIDEEPGSLANIFVMNQQLGRMPLYNVNENYDQLKEMAEALKEKYPNHPITKDLNERLPDLKKQIDAQKAKENAAAAITPGAMAPDISLPSPDGDEIALSDLRGKVVLVDFWAAWCGPCRKENPNLVATYNDFKDQGFTVYSVSLDGLQKQQNPKEAWVSAIEQDNLTWDNHVSDLQGWNSAPTSAYGIQSIPFTVLLDRDGKIIETGLRGPALRKKLEEVFGKS